MDINEVQHEGNEDFDVLGVRNNNQSKFDRIIDDIVSMGEPEEELEKKQNEYLNIDNPLLWDGDID